MTRHATPTPTPAPMARMAALALAPIALVGDQVVQLLLAALLLVGYLLTARHAVDLPGDGSRTLPLSEIASGLRRFSPLPVRALAAPDTPVLLSPGSDPSDPWEIEVALLRAGLRIRPRAGRLEIVPAA